MSLLKLHRGILWKNKTEPAINEHNLNQYDRELDGMDDRIIELYSTKLPTQEAGHFITDLDINPADGVVTVTYYSGRIVRYDTALEKIPFNYRFDADTQILYIIADDGTEQICNLSSLITQNEFRESDTITFDVSPDGKVKANIRRGSVTGDLLQPNFLSDVRIEAGKAMTSADSAASSAANAADLAAQAAGHADDAAASARTAAEYETAAGSDAATAAAKAAESAESATAAKESEDNAKASEQAVAANKDAASKSAQESAASAIAAAEGASVAASSAGNAERQALMAKSYAVGTDGIVRPGDATDNSQFFSDLAKKLTEDAQKLLDQAQKLVSAATTGAIIPAGTVTYGNLPGSPKVGYMYNIANAFITDERFVEGAGVYYNAGTNVYWTKDGQWDVMIGVQVTGVKGAAESDYHQGNVNITPVGIGLGNVNNTADADKVVKAADTATKAEQDSDGNNIADTYLKKSGDTKGNITTFESGDVANPTGWTDIGVLASGEKHDSLWHKVSLFLKNVRYIWKLMGRTSLNGIGDGTVTGAISKLNTDMGNIRVDVLFRGSFGPEWGGVDIYHPYTNYSFLAFVNGFGSCSIVEGNRSDINISITFNANNNIYTDAIRLIADTATYFRVVKRDEMVVTSEAATVFYPNITNPITAIYGIKL